VAALHGVGQEFEVDAFEEGLGFDGSSIRGFQEIQESDMLLVPDASTAFLDPFTAVPTLVLICDVKDPVTGEWYTRDPRRIATKAEAYLKSSGIADTAYSDRKRNSSSSIACGSARATTTGSTTSTRWKVLELGKDEAPNLGYKPRYKEATSPCRRWISSRTSAPR